MVLKQSIFFKEMKFSIITVNLNNQEGLKKTAESIVEQTISDYEWLVIDGGSTDGSLEVIRRYADKISYWVSEPDGGIYSAMNKGIAKSQGDYLLFLNSGDYLASNRIIENVSNHSLDSDFVVGAVSPSNDCGQNPTKVDYSPDEELMRLCVSSFPHQATFIHHNVFQKYGFYREDKLITSDWYLFICAVIRGCATVSYIPMVISIMEQGGISQRNPKLFFHERDSFLKETPYLRNLMYFFSDNYDLVCALKSNKFIFFLFRVYFWFYRKFNTV